MACGVAPIDEEMDKFHPLDKLLSPEVPMQRLTQRLAKLPLQTQPPNFKFQYHYDTTHYN